MVFLHCGVGGAQLVASLIDADSGSETAKQLSHAMNAPGDHGRGKMMRAGDHVPDDLGVLRVRHARFEHANDGRRPLTDTAEAYSFSNDRGVLVQRVGPESICEHDHAVCCRSIVLRSNQPPYHRMQSHHLKKRTTNHAASNRTWLTQSEHGETH